LFPGHPGLHHTVQIGCVHFQDAIHAGEINTQPGLCTLQLAFHTGTGTKGRHGNAVQMAELGYGDQLLLALHIGHRSRWRRGVMALTLAMLLQQVGVGRKPGAQ